MTRNIIACAAALAIVIGDRSSSDPTMSDEYAALQQELADSNQRLAAAEAELAEVTVERDALAADASPTSNSYDKTAAIGEIIDDPDSFGRKDEVLDLMMAMTHDDAVMDDTAFGPVPMCQAWSNTLSGVGATIETWVTWVCDDGSQAGSLWKWIGESGTGEPLELIGANLDEYDTDGKVNYSLVDWPYEASYVTESVASGTVAAATDG